MRKHLKLVLVLFVVILCMACAWFSLDEVTRCSFIYGKNICSFYGVFDIATRNHSASDFDRAMGLCSGMTEVPKKDSCFLLVAETFAGIDEDRAVQACNAIKDLRDPTGRVVHTREDCLDKISKKR